MNKKIAGVFEYVDQAVQVIEELKLEGYTMNEISFMAKNIEELNSIVRITNTTPASATDSSIAVGAFSGAITGAAAAGIYGLFAGMSALSVSGWSSAYAAGGVINAVRHSAKGLASGGIAGALRGTGISSEEAIQYEEYIREGRILVLIEADEDRKDKVHDIFTANESLISEMKKIQEKAKEALIKKHNKINREEFLEGLR
jgi:hypothetical protein